jgi:hypothetical protein
MEAAIESCTPHAGTPDTAGLERALDELNSFQLIVLVILWMLASPEPASAAGGVDIQPPSGGYLVFDNLDYIRGDKELDELLDGFVRALEYLDDLEAEGDQWLTRRLVAAHTKSCFIFTVRETTYFKLKSRHCELLRLQSLSLDITNAFPRTEIISKRKALLDRRPSLRTTRTGRLVEQVSELLPDSALVDRLFPLFNNNYRGWTIAVDSAFEEPGSLERALALWRKGGYLARAAGRGVFFRSMFDYFHNQGHFRGVLRQDLPPKDSRPSRARSKEQPILGSHPLLNTARMLLTFLSSETRPSSVTASTFHTDSVSLEDVFNKFDAVFTYEQMLRTLWLLFALDELKGENEHHIWARMVTFDDLSYYRYDELHEALQRHVRKRHREGIPYMFPRLRISAAGQTYLDSVVCHYEFIAARYPDRCPQSLFLYANPNDLTSGAYKEPLERVQQAVYDCSYSTMASFRSVLGAVPQWPDPDTESQAADRLFLNSGMAYQGQFHVERMVFSLIRYIDDFRLFSIQQVEDSTVRASINEFLSDHISQYLELFSAEGVTRQRHSRQGAGAADYMRQRITQIQRDFTATGDLPINLDRW